MTTLDQQLVEAGRRVHRARRHFHHERTRAAMRALLDAIDEYRATAHGWCVCSLPRERSQPDIQELSTVM